MLQLEARGHPGISIKNLSDWSKTGFVEWKQEQKGHDLVLEPEALARALSTQVHPEGRLTQTLLNDYLTGFLVQRTLASLNDPKMVDSLRADPVKVARYLSALTRLQSESTQRLQTELGWAEDRQLKYQQLVSSKRTDQNYSKHSSSSRRSFTRRIQAKSRQTPENL